MSYNILYSVTLGCHLLVEPFVHSCCGSVIVGIRASRDSASSIIASTTAPMFLCSGKKAENLVLAEWVKSAIRTVRWEEAEKKEVDGWMYAFNCFPRLRQEVVQGGYKEVIRKVMQSEEDRRILQDRVARNVAAGEESSRRRDSAKVPWKTEESYEHLWWPGESKTASRPAVEEEQAQLV